MFYVGVPCRKVATATVGGRTAIRLTTDHDQEIVFPSGSVDLAGDFHISTWALTPSSMDGGSFIFSTDYGELHGQPWNNINLFSHDGGWVRMYHYKCFVL